MNLQIFHVQRSSYHIIIVVLSRLNYGKLKLNCSALTNPKKLIRRQMPFNIDKISFAKRITQNYDIQYLWKKAKLYEY